MLHNKYMYNVFKFGEYSDIIVKFNNKEYKLHLLLLKDKSLYFCNISKKKFKEQSRIEIIFEQLNGQLLNTSFFDSFIDAVYDNIFCISDKFNICEIVEFYRLLDYLQYTEIIQFKFNEHIIQQLNKCVPIKNNVDDIIKQYINLTPLRYLGKKYSSVQGNSCDIMIDVTCWNGCKLSTGFKNPRNIIYNQIQQIHLDKIDFYELDYNITYPYVEYLFKLVSDDSHRNKIIGISNLQIKDLDFFDKKYHKLILQHIL